MVWTGFSGMRWEQADFVLFGDDMIPPVVDALDIVLSGMNANAIFE